MSNSMINIQGLTKNYKNFSFGPLDFQVEKGTVVALIGANGSGKTTFFRLVMNLLQSESGKVEFFGSKLTDKETNIKQNIGYVGGLIEAYSHLTIREMANFVSYWYPTWDDIKYKQFLQRYLVDETEKYSKCSTGTKKKVEFIFAITHNPFILLLDEPTAGVDISSQRKMKEDLMTFMEDGEKSIVIATHVVDEVKQLCDFIAVIEKGQLIHILNKDDIFDHWAKMWVSAIPESLKQHQNVLTYNESDLFIVTDHRSIIESHLENEQVSITHLDKLSLEEVIEYLIEKENTDENS